MSGNSSNSQSVSLPNIPSNTFTLLTTFADAIDTANSNLTKHAGKLNDIHTSTNNAVTEVTTHSKGQATDTLSHLWTGSKSDLTNAHDKLTTITSSSVMGSSSSDFRSTLNENKAAILNGISAMASLQSSGNTPVTTDQVEQWKNAVDSLNSAMSNVSMALDAITMAITTQNNGFSATCASGLTPGHPLPLFNKNTFAHQAHSSGSGGGSSSAEEANLRNALKDKGITGSEADLLILNAQGSGISFKVITKLLDQGVSKDTIEALASSGNHDLEDLITQKAQHNLDDLQSGKITQRQYNTKMQSMNDIVTTMYSKPEYVQAMADHKISVKDIYDTIDDSNVDFRMTPDNAITSLTGPKGTAKVEVAGPSGKYGDVKFYDDKGNLIFTRENKALTTTTRNGFENSVKAAAKEMHLQDGQHAEIFLQMQPGTSQSDIKSWMQHYMGPRIQAGQAGKYQNVSVKVVDPSGHVIYAGKMIP